MKEDLMFCSLGNGISVCDKSVEVSGDYKSIAHISRNREITWYAKRISKEAKDKIEDYAKNGNSRISVTQMELVLKPLGVSEERLRHTQLEYSKIAQEKIEVNTFKHSDDIYAYGSELACLKLAKHFEGEKLNITHVDNDIWCFVLYEKY